MNTKQIIITVTEDKEIINIILESKNLNKLELIGLLHEAIKLVQTPKKD